MDSDTLFSKWIIGVVFVVLFMVNVFMFPTLRGLNFGLKFVYMYFLRNFPVFS